MQAADTWQTIVMIILVGSTASTKPKGRIKRLELGSEGVEEKYLVNRPSVLLPMHSASAKFRSRPSLPVITNPMYYKDKTSSYKTRQ